MRGFTEEQKQFILDNYFGKPWKETTELFNKKFNTSYSVSTIKGWGNKNGLSSGICSKFQKGNVSWQTGLSKEEYWKHFSEDTKKQVIESLKPKQKYKDGDIVIRHGLPAFYVDNGGGKLDDNIVYCSVKVWEEHYGKVNPDCIVIHLDGDVMNYSIENLRQIPRSYLPNLKYLGGLTDNKELNETKLKYCELKDALRGVKE
jgi:hypothetical protein